MGNILEFVVRHDRVRRRPVLVGGVRPPCEIVILPCVRYERFDDNGSKPTPHKKKGRRRRVRSR